MYICTDYRCQKLQNNSTGVELKHNRCLFVLSLFLLIVGFKGFVFKILNLKKSLKFNLLSHRVISSAGKSCFSSLVIKLPGKMLFG